MYAQSQNTPIDYERAERCARAERDLAGSRFIETGKDADGKPFIRKITERQISQAVDMADCYDEDNQESNLFYLGDDLVLHEVTIGPQCRFDNSEDSFEFAASDIIANGQVVGSVTYTDH